MFKVIALDSGGASASTYRGLEAALAFAAAFPSVYVEVQAPAGGGVVYVRGAVPDHPFYAAGLRSMRG